MTNNTIPNVPREMLDSLLTVIDSNGYAADEVEVVDELRALLSAPSPAGVDGLEVIGWYTDDHLDDKSATTYSREVADRWLAKGWPVTGIANAADAQAIIDGLRGEVADLHTTMMAAAVEIQEHWAAHCDEEGYGPANLMHRLERGIASQYGYSAETLVRLESQRDKLALRIGEMEGLLRHAQKQVPTGSGLHMRIEAALSAGKEGE